MTTTKPSHPSSAPSASSAASATAHGAVRDVGHASTMAGSSRPEPESANGDGLLLFAHGARDPAWAAPFQAIAAELQNRRPGLPLALAYLELMTPDLATAAGALVALGCQRIQIVPMFLGSSGHVRRDVPPQVEALRREYPGVLFLLHDAIGEQPSVIRAMAAATLDLVSAVSSLPGALLTAPQDPAAASATPARQP